MNSAASPSHLRMGFVELLDAAPLVAAQELGYFSDEGLRVTLEPQIGWGNVRDKLVHGHIHASHALVGMPPVSLCEAFHFPQPLTAIMSLGAGGDAITLSRRLTDAGVDGASQLSRYIRSVGRAPLLAHVFGCSMHHYLLREWLAAGGVDPDRDVRLCVLPPTQMPRQCECGSIDGFCAGEPWNTLVEQRRLGKIVAVTTDILPDHPDKVLAVTRSWLDRNPTAAAALVRAVVRGCLYCADANHLAELADVLSPPAYLGIPAEIVRKSLTLGRWFGGPSRISPGPVRSCAPASTFPAATHAAWILQQMIRWKHLPAETDVADISARAVSTAIYRNVAAALKIDCPDDDFPPMRLRSGWFHPKSDFSERTKTLRASIPGFRADSGLPARQGV